MKFLNLKSLICGMLISVLLAAGSAQAFQSRPQNNAAPNEIKTLDNKLNQLERQLRAVQRRVFADGNAPADEALVSEEAGISSQQRLMADLSARFGGLEQQLRSLTGRLEELEYAQRQNQEALELLRREIALQAAAPLNIPTGEEGAVGNGLEKAASHAQQSGGSAAGQTVGRGAESYGQSAGQSQAIERPVVTVALPEGSPSQRYDYAFSFVRVNDLVRGKIAMAQFLEAHPKDPLAPNALFWLGRMSLLENTPAQAARYFLRLIEEYPSHNKRADTLVDLAESLIKLESAEDACDALAEYEKIKEQATPRLKTRATALAKQARCR